MGHSVWIAADTLGYPTGAGHLWAYLNWALGLRAAGCEVTWMEPCHGPPDAEALALLRRRLAGFGLERVCLFAPSGSDAAGSGEGLVPVEQAEDADLLLNLAYDVPVPL
ncbi:MAG: hypothetical protein ACM3UX_01650, partial [Candidatus Woesearchaeota archaeon]